MNFSGEVCEQGIVTGQNLAQVLGVFPTASNGAVLISKACYESRIVRAKAEAIQRLNK
jgi:multisubunit Na+/H+ antiporter MnhG subunit